MTRETKVGLVVACSFLCLVGVVLGGKLTQAWRGNSSDDAADEQVASNDRPAKTKKDGSGKLDTVAAPLTKPDPSPVITTGGVRSSSEPAPLPPLPDEEDSRPAVVSQPADAVRPRDAAKKNPNNDDAPFIEPDPMKSDGSKTDDLPPLPPASAKKEKPDPDNLPPLPPAGKDDDADGKQSVRRGADSGKIKDDQTNPSKDTEQDPVDAPPPPPAKLDKPAPTDPTITLTPKGTDPKSDVPPDTKKTVPAVPVPPDNLTGDDKTKQDDGKRVALNKLTPTDVDAGVRGAPRVGEPPRASAPPIAVPASRVPTRPAAGAPRVESYDEQTYRPRPEDNFASISQHCYQSDKYAQALLQFNREHPRAGDGVKRDPPNLSGQAVYIPPIYILEKRHGDAIEGYTPQPTSPSPVGRDAPRGEGGGAPTVRPTPPAPAATTYQVSPNGETLMEIARTKLGRGDRWVEIDKLNPGWRPDFPIPGGTVLRLPSDPRGAP